MEGPHTEEGSVWGTHSRASSRGQRRLAETQREREREREKTSSVKGNQSEG